MAGPILNTSPQNVFWLLARSGTEGQAVPVDAGTVTFGGSTLTGLIIANPGAGGAGGTDVSIVGPTSATGATTAVLVSDIGAGGGGGVVQQGSRDVTDTSNAWWVSNVAPVSASQSGAWTVSVTAATLPVVSASQSGAWTVSVTAATLPVVSASQSGAWNVTANVATQGSLGTLSHLSSATVRAGTINAATATAHQGNSGAQPWYVQKAVTKSAGHVERTTDGSFVAISGTAGSNIRLWRWDLHNKNTGTDVPISFIASDTDGSEVIWAGGAACGFGGPVVCDQIGMGVSDASASLVISLGSNPGAAGLDINLGWEVVTV